jgi:hypothetical protein
LSVRPEILIPETLDNLKIPLKPRDHEKLLEKLWGLRQGIEFTGIDSAGNEIVPSPFGGAAGKKGGLDFEKTLIHEIGPCSSHHLMPLDQPLMHGTTAQIEITILQPNRFPRVDFILDGKGEGLGLIENFDCVRHHLIITGWDLFVDGILRPVATLSQHRDDIFIFQGMCQDMGFRGNIRVENYLGDAAMIPKIDKNNAAVVPPRLDPPHKSYLFIKGVFADNAAEVCSL